MRHADNIISFVIVRGLSGYEGVIRFANPRQDVRITSMSRDGIINQAMRLVRFV